MKKKMIFILEFRETFLFDLIILMTLFLNIDIKSNLKPNCLCLFMIINNKEHIK